MGESAQTGKHAGEACPVDFVALQQRQCEQVSDRYIKFLCHCRVSIRLMYSPSHVCVALIDIDFFKSINDKYGHAGGDAVLQGFAREAGATLRAADTLARWGGEEFLLLMPDTGLDEALAVLGRIGTGAKAMRLDALDPQLVVTFPAGVTASKPLERFDEAISRADAAMYRAKANGRNCVLAA
jgi:diguanylate cyclase (GGDEF)-like protein